MTRTPRRRYRVRLRSAVAGSFLAAASVTSLLGVGAAPAPAAASEVIVQSPDQVDDEISNRTRQLDNAPTVGARVPLLVAAGRTSSERLAGVGADLDRAVLLQLITPEQAGGFYAQVERRVASGL
ncbi:hypothetical protein E8P82_08565 [Arthrobacter echini]|uniref:Uncharacterized protein n=1 Tax=Arthrobacter echini TaxID=1529066 RepID=A0A4S5E4Z7_9MICC|nr:hypothetical protein [Arthrobacter echini]THJ66500.1 hypothetical protein E8P82_08565 [Arthrobacter echini]